MSVNQGESCTWDASTSVHSGDGEMGDAGPLSLLPRPSTTPNPVSSWTEGSRVLLMGTCSLLLEHIFESPH